VYIIMSNDDIVYLLIIVLAVVLIIHYFRNDKRRIILDNYAPIAMPPLKKPRVPDFNNLDPVKDSLTIFDTENARYENSSCNLNTESMEAKRDFSCSTVKEFNDDFFRFRDYLWKDSSMTQDPVDKINQLYLSGDLSTANNCKTTKIKDIYDNATKGVDLYHRTCTRQPYFDKDNPEGYLFSFGSPITKLAPYDPEFKDQLDYQLLKNF
jgi:hypothetical protein